MKPKLPLKVSTINVLEESNSSDIISNSDITSDISDSTATLPATVTVAAVVITALAVEAVAVEGLLNQ